VPGAAGTDGTTPPAVDGSHVYIASGTQVYGYPTSCSNPCTPVWETQSTGTNQYLCAPALANGILYITSSIFGGGPPPDSRIVYAYDTTDKSCGLSCTPVWTSGPNHLLNSGIAIAGNIDVGSSAGFLSEYG
jgi:hypothetical protein